ISDTLYYWQVRSVDNTDGQNLMSAYSSLDSFRTLAILPVTFINFDGVIQNGKALLSWSTANEINNKGFEVQKSTNGQTFTDLGFVAGHNNSSTVNNYNYTDAKVVSGANYYRLKQIDNNGNFDYSSVIKLDYAAFDWNILGNPVSGNSWIQLQLDKSSEVSIQIVSMNGNIIQTINKGNLSAGTFSIPINLSGKSAGLYVVRLMVDGQPYSKKIVK
ncbi:MAG: T9SS type A sorting domain-containing protein, partial [Chitinophagaceae bacterium]